jgi:hypothetical protein
MRHLRGEYLSVLFLLVCCPWLLQATDWPPLDPAELQMKDAPEKPGAPAVVLFREVIVDHEKGRESTYVRLKVLTDAGRKYGDVQIPYATEWGAERVNVKARTIHSDGSIAEFQGQVLDKIVEKQKDGLRTHVKTFTLPDVQVGSILEYRYDFAQYPLWVVQDELFQRKVHFLFTGSPHATIAMTCAWQLPKDAQIEQRWGHFDVKLTDVPAFEEEVHMPPPDRFQYFVWFYPVPEEKDVVEYWKQRGKELHEATAWFMQNGGSAASTARKITAANDSAEDKARKIYAYVQSLDNLTYKPKLSQKEVKAQKLKDRNVADILKQQAGENDELTILYVAMVRAVGIPAHVMWVTNRDHHLFDKKLFTVYQLNDLIAVLEIDGKEVYLDPGTKFCPYGLLYWPHTSTEGLRETDKGAELRQTPPPIYTDAVEKKVARLKLDDKGVISGVMGVGYFGQQALTNRIDGSKTDDVGRTKLLEDEVKHWLPENAEVTLTKQPNWDDSAAPFSAEFKISVPMSASAGKRILLPTNVFEFARPAVFGNTERKYPVYFQYPFREIDEIRVQLPEGMEVETLPEDEFKKVDYAYYRFERKQEQNVVTVLRDFAINSFVFTLSDYKNLKAFFDKMQDGDQQQAVLKQAKHVAQN